MDMTTLARVKILTPVATADEARVSAWIAQLSSEVERALNRVVLAAAQTDYFNVRQGQRVFQIHAYPVTAWTEVANDTDRSFGSETVIASSSYATWDANGVLEFDIYQPVQGAKVLRVKYTGGMAASAAAFVAAYPDLAGAIDAQIAHMIQRRWALGAESISADGASISVNDPTKWLPVLKRAIDTHRRVSVG